MPANEMFQSALRTSGDLAGVFEYDGETGYFYLYQTNGNEVQRVIGAIQVAAGYPDFQEDDLAIRWDASETMVGLFIRGGLWAAFDGKTGAKYGGNYRSDAQPSIPTEVIDAFE